MLTPVPVVFCADVGSVKRGRFGWARAVTLEGSSIRGESIEVLASAVAEDLRSGALVALGFECPLFVPIREQPEALTDSRRGEGNRPWSAGAGCASLGIGIPQVVWVLREVKRLLEKDYPVSFSWDDVARSGGGLYLWEAFVSADAKATGTSGLHALDAELAVRAFLRALPDLEEANAIHEDEVQSLVGAALIRTGWSSDLRILGEPCLVVRA